MAKTYDVPKERPTGKVSSLAISRTKKTLKYKATWKVPSALTSKSGEDGKRRTTALERDFVIDVFKPGKKNDPKDIIKHRDTSNERSTAMTLNLNSFSVTTGSGKKRKTTKYTRKSFYPLTSRRVKGIAAKVWCANSHGASKAVASKTYEVNKPLKPKVDAPEQAKETGRVSCKVTAYDGSGGSRERYDTRYQLEVHDSRAPKDKKYTYKVDDTFTGDSYTVARDIKDRMQLSYSQYVRFRVRAMSRGLAGMSDGLAVTKEDESKAWTDWKTLYVSYPNQAVIPADGVKVPDISQSLGKVTVGISVNSTTEHPTTGVRLQKLRSSSAKTALAATMDEGWEDTDSIDNGGCTALALTVDELIPESGKTTWVRVKSWNQFEDMFYRFSVPVRIKALETPVPTVDKAAMISAVPGGDGSTAVATVGWNADTSNDDNVEGTTRTTELSWSTDENALRATKGPETYEFGWSDGRYPKTGTRKYKDSAEVHIKDLDEGELYYVWARRHLEADGIDEWSGYAGPLTVKPVSTPSSVVLRAQAYLPTGSDLALSWTYDSEATQSEWQVLTGKSKAVKNQSTFDGTGTEVEHRELNDKNPTVVMSGTDADGSCVVRWSWFAEHQSLVGSDGTIWLCVRMGTGGGLVDSLMVPVTIVEAPTLALDVGETLAAQPMAIGVTCSTRALVTLVVRATNGGVDGYLHGREHTQADGDTAWSTAVTPAWAEGESGYTATIEAPVLVGKLYDNGTYRVTATANDPVTGLSSTEQTATFTVAWAHQAPKPSEGITVTPSDTTNEESGFRTRMCAIQLAEPENADEGDVYDVCRVTPDGTYLIAENVSTDGIVYDEFAPYGGEVTQYRVYSKTVDGDTDYLDFDYELAGKDLRIDFGNTYVELPYNLTMTDSYAKDFEARRKLDGSVDGYWNQGVQRTGGFTTDLIRRLEQGKAARVRELAHHSGPCFVRTPDGCAYMADVQVGSVGATYNDAALAVTISATEVALTDEYMGTVPVPESPEGSGDEEGEEAGG